MGELPSKLRKFVVFCGEADAGAVWGALDSGREMARSSQPLLILHGGADPLVTEAEVLEIAARAGADEVRVVIYSDGDHCSYNHPADKHDLIAEWIRAAARRP
jgi:alpha-beta hydrolase superfamily lysophospholipase